jgi:hypothetical protein
MGLDVDWQHGEDHMRTGHQITGQAANEALADPDALLFDPDPKSTSGQSARVIGFSPTADRGPRGHPRPARGQARIMVGRQRLAGEQHRPPDLR